MRLSYFSEDFLQLVRRTASAEHETRYESPTPWVHTLQGSRTGIRESQIETIDLPVLTCEPETRTESDAANSIALYERLKKLTPVQASDERLWAHLTHTYYWEYMRTRWPRSRDDSFESIETRWFFKGSAMERLARNGLARLWWGSHATVLPGTPDPYRLTRVLFKNTEVQFGYMERLIGKNRCVLHTCLNFIELNQSRITNCLSLSDWARGTGKMLNSIGGVLQLDALKAAEVEKILEDFLAELYLRKSRSRQSTTS
jgi:hypothetical protein